MNDPYTPIHNEVLEALCKINLSPYETRVLFCIWRKTYGFIDKKTKERKKNDWISGSQISQMTNLDRRYVSRALKGLKNKHVISRDDKDTRFSKEFMKLMSSVEMTVISRDDKDIVISRGGTPPPVEMTPSPSRDDKLSSVEGHTKEKKENIQKKLIQKKDIATDVALNPLITLFKGVNPNYDRLYANKTERDALQRQVDKFSYKRIENLLNQLPEIVARPFSPRITKPTELERKMGQLIIFLNQGKNDKRKVVDARGI